MIAFYLILTGLLSMGYAFSANMEGFVVYVVEGLVSVLLGGLLLAGWPFSGLWAIGLFLGIDLILKGAEIVALGLRLRSISE